MEQRYKQDAGSVLDRDMRCVVFFAACMLFLGCKEELATTPADPNAQSTADHEPEINAPPIMPTAIAAERVYASTEKTGEYRNGALNRSEDGRCVVVIDMESAVMLDSKGNIRWESAPLGGSINSIGIGDQYVVAVANKDQAAWTRWVIWIDRQAGRIVEQLPLTSNVSIKRRIAARGCSWAGALWVPMDDGGLVRIQLDSPGSKSEIVLPSAPLTTPVGWQGHGLIVVTENELALIKSDQSEIRLLGQRSNLRYPEYIVSPPAIWEDQLALIGIEEVVFISLSERQVLSRKAISSIGDLINPPIFFEGYLIYKSTLDGFKPNHSGLACIDSQTGEIVWRQRIKSTAFENNMALIKGTVAVPEEFEMENEEKATAVAFFDLATGDRFATYVVEGLSPQIGHRLVCVPPFILGSDLHLCDRYGNVYCLSDPQK